MVIVRQKRLQVGVIGSAGKEEYRKDHKYYRGYLKVGKKIGCLLGEAGVIVITGGEGGIMDVVERGAKETGGTTIGIFKFLHDIVGEKYSDVEIISGMGEGGPEYILPMCCNVIISMGGGAGTLNEVSVAYRQSVPVVLLTGYGGWTDKISKNLHEKHYLDERKRVKFYVAKTPEEAVELAIKVGKDHLKKIMASVKGNSKNQRSRCSRE
jgi:uncharacterized protein (TIGR00725 family)